MSKNDALGQIVSGFKSLLNTDGDDADTGDRKVVTLRYSTESVDLDFDEVKDQTVQELFDENADDLGLPTNGSLGVRSEGEAVDAASTPEAGRTYTASVSRETKGS